ncbi:olfactory receptor 6N2-like [Anomaloglossus baeobatrachus]|uniref:olfactory receptor 6N2-like n=1 Tax=Anomaloglossus baeobatrachus TaxID=238106 RepID=UPI003F509C33
MEQLNKTLDLYSDFFLVGFSGVEQYGIYLFIFFLIIYLFSLSGNTIIILVVWSNINLHTPMYFFITVLAFLDAWYVSTTVPKLLSILLTNNKRISFQGCFVQLYMFQSFGITECALLAIMAFDRCTAIYNPLRYTSILTERVCKVLISICWSYGFLVAIMPLVLAVRLPYCNSHDLTHYFCDVAPLMAIACVDPTPINIANQSVSTVATFFILLFVITMYIIIIYSILKIKTSQGRSKAFSTCSSHLTVVILFYGTAFIVYVVPKELHTVKNDMIYAMIYTMFIPFLNPLIYSLRNKDVKGGFRKSLQKFQEHVCKS